MRKDQASCHLKVGDRDVPIVFSKRTGGKSDSEEEKHFPGGGRKQKAVGGPETTENVMLEGEYEASQQDLVKWLRSRRNRPCVVTEQELDEELNAFGRPTTWTGLIKAVDSGEYDSSGGVRLVSVEVSTHGEVA